MIFEPPSLDWWKEPNLTEVFQARARVLAEIEAQEDPEVLVGIRSYYREHLDEFISDWGCTVDPRNADVGLPVVTPFLLYPKQVECLEWILDRWRSREDGIIEKSRTVGMSWLTIALASSLCLFNQGVSIGFGSYLKEYVDQTGEPKAIMVKGRYFMSYLPAVFQEGWDEENDAPYMRMFFRKSDSQIGGQVGDEIGRGDRRTIYFVDESARLEHPYLVDASLSETTNCRIDFSSVNGMANSFAERRHSGKVKVFTFGWRDDPRRDEKWYEEQCAKRDPVVIAQELDMNYQASEKGILIPSAWAQAAVNAHERLGFTPSGIASGALDVADEGKDMNAFAGARGVHLNLLREWSGKGDDIYGTTLHAFSLCDEHKLKSFRYDADGLGAGVRGDARVINERRRASRITVEPFRGSGEVFEPDKNSPGTDRTNRDFFANAKAQGYWGLRSRFEQTVKLFDPNVPAADKAKISRDSIISIDKSLPLINKLLVELSQPTYALNGAGKVLVNKQPEGTKSPNLADAVMIRFAPMRRQMVISDKAMSWAAGRNIIGARTQW